MDRTIGSKLLVYRGKAQHTSGGLTRQDLKKNNRGKVVSIRRSDVQARINNLGDYLSKRQPKAKIRFNVVKRKQEKEQDIERQPKAKTKFVGVRRSNRSKAPTLKFKEAVAST